MIKKIVMAAVIAERKGIKRMPDASEFKGTVYGDSDKSNCYQTSVYRDAAKGIADLVVKKQKAYGRSYQKAGKVLELLYPDGVKPDQYQDMLGVVRVLDKLFRLATEKDAMGESPY